MDPTRDFQALIDTYLVAYVAHDAAGCAALYSTDAQVISPFGPPATGRPEIEAAHLAWFEEGEANKTMTVIRAGAEGNVGFCLVRFRADVPTETGVTEEFRGVSLNVLQREAKGSWKISLTSLNEIGGNEKDSDQ